MSAYEPMTHRQVTDAHLLQLTQRHGGVLATFDREVHELAGHQAGTLVRLIGRAPGS